MFVKLSVSSGHLDLNDGSLPIDRLANGWQWLPLKTFAIPSIPIAVSPKSIPMPMEPMVTLQPINHLTVPSSIQNSGSKSERLDSRVKTLKNLFLNVKVSLYVCSKSLLFVIE